MLPAKLASEAFLRHIARNAVTSTESVIAAGPSTIPTALRGFEALSILRNGSRASYATQAGQPMPPSPPYDKQQNEKSDSRSATTSTASTVSENSTVPIGDAPVASTSKSIKPISSIASQYLDMTEIPADAAERQRTGARSTLGKKAESSSDRRRRAYARSALAISVFGAGAFAWHLGRDWESEREKLRVGREVTEESGMQGRLQRAQARLIDMSDYFNKPAWEPLIPEPLPPPHQKPYTLLLSLDDLLIHSEWSRDNGWRTAKRPGVDYFIQYMSQFYEIVLFTSQPFYTAAPIAEKLDPFGLYMPYKLFRDCTRYTNKEIVKDLSYLGRDLKKVVMLDTDPQHFRLQPENAIQMEPWKGGSTDRDLVGMIPFLEALAIYQVPDVRPVLQRYSGKHIPTAWAEVEAEQKRAVLEEWEKTRSSVKGKIGSGFGGMFGVSNPQVRHESGPPKTQLEREREIYQRAYQDEQKYWVDNKSILENARKEDEEKQKEAMGKSVFAFVAAQMGLVPPPDPNAQANAQTQQAK